MKCDKHYRKLYLRIGGRYGYKWMMTTNCVHMEWKRKTIKILGHVFFSHKIKYHEKWKWSLSVVSVSLWPYGLWPTSLLHPWNFPGKNTGVGCHFLLQGIFQIPGTELRSPALQADSLPCEPPRTDVP